MNTIRMTTAALLLATSFGSATSALAFDPIVSIGGQRPVIHPGGGHQEVLATKEQTGGKFGMTVTTDPAGSTSGGGSMTHGKEAEMWYVLDGTFEFHIAGKTYEGGPGTFVAVDAGQPHDFVTKTAGTLLMFWMPGGFEHFFIDWDKSGIAPGPKLAPLEQQYGVTRP